MMRTTGSRQLGVDDGHTVGGDEHGAVAAAALHHVQVVLQLVDLDHLRRRLTRGLLEGRDGHRKRSGGSEHSEHEQSSHPDLHRGAIIAQDVSRRQPLFAAFDSSSAVTRYAGDR
jgi:hypothetical protein